jgi:hypothetical protein
MLTLGRRGRGDLSDQMLGARAPRPPGGCQAAARPTLLKISEGRWSQGIETTSPCSRQRENVPFQSQQKPDARLERKGERPLPVTCSDKAKSTTPGVREGLTVNQKRERKGKCKKMQLVGLRPLLPAPCDKSSGLRSSETNRGI